MESVGLLGEGRSDVVQTILVVRCNCRDVLDVLDRGGRPYHRESRAFPSQGSRSQGFGRPRDHLFYG